MCGNAAVCEFKPPNMQTSKKTKREIGLIDSTICRWRREGSSKNCLAYEETIICVGTCVRVCLPPPLPLRQPPLLSYLIPAAVIHWPAGNRPSTGREGEEERQRCRSRREAEGQRLYRAHKPPPCNEQYLCTGRKVVGVKWRGSVTSHADTGLY